MNNHIRRFIRQALRVILPALVFLATGLAAVARQGVGYQLEEDIRRSTAERSTLLAQDADLKREIVHLESRSRIIRFASDTLGMRQPEGEDIVVLKLVATED